MQFSSFSYTSALIIHGKLRSISRDKAVGKEGRGRGDSLTLLIRRCAAEQGMVSGSFVYNFRLLSCIFINRHVLRKLSSNSEQTIQEPLIFQVGPYFKPVL